MCERLTFSRYLCETGTYTELHQMAAVAMSAFHAWRDHDNHPLILADLERHISTEWLQRGNFKQSEDHMRKSIAIYEKHAGSDRSAFLAPYNHMGNVVASANRYEESLEWQKKVEAISHTLVDDTMKRVALTNCNFGRSLFLLRRFDEALDRYQKAVQQFTESENWAMLSL